MGLDQYRYASTAQPVLAGGWIMYRDGGRFLNVNTGEMRYPLRLGRRNERQGLLRKYSGSGWAGTRWNWYYPPLGNRAEKGKKLQSYHSQMHYPEGGGLLGQNGSYSHNNGKSWIASSGERVHHWNGRKARQDGKLYDRKGQEQKQPLILHGIIGVERQGRGWESRYGYAVAIVRKRSLKLQIHLPNLFRVHGRSNYIRMMPLEFKKNLNNAVFWIELGHSNLGVEVRMDPEVSNISIKAGKLPTVFDDDFGEPGKLLHPVGWLRLQIKRGYRPISALGEIYCAFDEIYDRPTSLPGHGHRVRIEERPGSAEGIIFSGYEVGLAEEIIASHLCSIPQQARS